MGELVNYGALGIMVLGFVTGVVVSKSTNDRIIEERDRAERQRDEILEDVFTRVAPTIEKATDAIKSRETYEAEIHELLVDVRRLLERRQ